VQRTRRDLLIGGAAISLTGCLSVDGVTYPDEPAPEKMDSDGGPTGDQSSDPPTTDSRGPHAELAAETRRVANDAIWFAVSYPSAIDTYGKATDSVRAAVASVRESITDPTDPTVEMVQQLEAAGYDAAERAAAALKPHFHPAELLRSRTDRHIPPLTKAAQRNDADRFIEELERMDLSFFQIQTPIYIGRRFSRDPIHNRLLDRLVPDAPEKVFLELATPGHRQFSTLVYQPYPDNEETYPPTFTDEALSESRQESLRDRLGPVIKPGGRTAEVIITAATRPKPADRSQNAFRGSPGDLNGTALHIQRYADADTAGERLATILSAGSTEGSEPIVRRQATGDSTIMWHRYYHREAGSTRTGLDDFAGVQYGYLLQAGEFLLATGFSGDAWEERPRWQSQIVNTWVTK